MKEEVFIKMALDAWQTYLKRTDDLFNELSDEKLAREVSPGRNSGIYLLGHLTAVHDRMLPQLGLGEPLYPDLYEPFVAQPDGAVKAIPSVGDLRKYWKKVTEKLNEGISRVKPDDWFSRHNVVSEEDFKKDPKRNRLNIVLTRIPHLTYHFGQLKLLKR